MDKLGAYVRHEAAVARVQLFNALLADRGYVSRLFMNRPGPQWVHRGEAEERRVTAQLDAAWEDFERACRKILGTSPTTFQEELEKGDDLHA